MSAVSSGRSASAAHRREFHRRSLTRSLSSTRTPLAALHSPESPTRMTFNFTHRDQQQQQHEATTCERSLGSRSWCSRLVHPVPSVIRVAGRTTMSSGFGSALLAIMALKRWRRRSEKEGGRGLDRGAPEERGEWRQQARSIDSTALDSVTRAGNREATNKRSKVGKCCTSFPTKSRISRPSRKEQKKSSEAVLLCLLRWPLQAKTQRKVGKLKEV